MAETFDTVSRPNSRSMAARSSRSISKISLPLMAAGLLTLLLTAEIAERAKKIHEILCGLFVLGGKKPLVRPIIRAAHVVIHRRGRQSRQETHNSRRFLRTRR